MHLVDTHCHLYILQPEDELEKIIEDAFNRNIIRIMVPGIDLETSIQAIQISEQFEHVYAAVGFHPNDSDKWNSESYDTLVKLAQHPKVKAIGEIGLDFYRDYVSPEDQVKVFLEQISLAKSLDLPVIIHSRNSISKIIDLLSKYQSERHKKNLSLLQGVLHSFEGTIDEANQVINLNMFIGIGGPVTYKNAYDKHELAKHIPISNILLETDSPFLSPVPFRGKQNKPENINLIAEKIANFSEKPLKWISQETTENANKLFAWEQ